MYVHCQCPSPNDPSVAVHLFVLTGLTVVPNTETDTEGAMCVTIGRISVLCMRCGLKVQNVTLADYSTI